jgi:hypothetical protein
MHWAASGWCDDCLLGKHEDRAVARKTLLAVLQSTWDSFRDEFQEEYEEVCPHDHDVRAALDINGEIFDTFEETCRDLFADGRARAARSAMGAVYVIASNLGVLDDLDLAFPEPEPDSISELEPAGDLV